MTKSNQITKLVNGEIADADIMNQIVEDAGVEGGAIPYDPTTHERSTDGSQSLGTTAYPWGSLKINKEAELVEVDPSTHTAANSVLFKNLRKLTYLKDCPSSYTGKGTYPVRVKEDESGLEFAPLTNSQIFTGNGTFTVPAGVSRLYISLVGGGGGGGGSDNINVGAGGGGGGAALLMVPYAVTASQSCAVVVGAGGAGGDNTHNGSNGGVSSFDSVLVVNGGSGGAQDATPAAGGAGGTKWASTALDGADASSGVSAAGGKQGYTEGFAGGAGGDGNANGGGAGGGSAFGKGATGVQVGSGAGISAAANSGAGGSGAGNGNSSGGNGGSGCVVVMW